MLNPDRRFKDSIYENFSRVGKAVSSAKRLELLDLLTQGERTVEVIALEAGVSVANASKHLQALRAARLVEAEKNGTFVIYRIADEDVGVFLRNLTKLCESRLAEVRQIARDFLEGREGMVPTDKETLLKRVRDGEVIVLDVRPPEEYRAGHIPGAVSVPLKEIEVRLKALPKKRMVVAYCRGPYCVLAVKAVEILRANGFNAVRLEDSVADWRDRGFPVAVGG